MDNKKTLLLVLATILTLGLTAVAVVTSMKLKEIGSVPVAPNVPVSQPRADTGCFVAAGGACVVGSGADNECCVSGLTCVVGTCVDTTKVGACQLSFTVDEPIIGCYDPCSTTSQCTSISASSSDWVCGQAPCPSGAAACLTVQVCYNPDCPYDDDCLCNATPTPTPSPTPTPTATPTPTPTPTGTPEPLTCNDYCANTSDCPSAYICSWNKCRNAECPSDDDCVCENPPGCNETCDVNNDQCVGGYVCNRETSTCRNSECMDEADCTCAVVPPPPAEELPTAGSPIPGFLFLTAGAVLLVLGVLVVGL